ncbi:MAG: sodium:solute symporter, partial [Turneriella sp.]|nr:sodium:solute symporter [Turneriella sp.]
MRSADWVVLVLYFILLQVVGFATGKKQKNTTDYLLASRSLPWWAVAASIVAAETSALTFISVPGIAYTGNFTFMQLAFGYVVGRILVAFFLLPAYFRGQCETVYAFLEKRFSRRMRLFAALVFQLTRLLATGVRLYATALPLALISGWSVPVAVLVFAALTLPYIFSGGLRSGVWVESVQAVVYLA